MKAMRLVEYGTPLRLEEIEAPRADNGVLVKVVAAGVCHTDIHVISGSYDLGNGSLLKMADRGIRLPITPGHEIAGEVVDLGVFDGKTAIREGERVVVFPWLGCGTCRKCVAGYENYCEVKPSSIGIFQDGGYAEYVSVPHPRYLVPAAGLRAEEAAPLACSGLTSYSALNKCRLESEELLVIIGAGGLGTTAIQLANRTTGARVVVLDIEDSKLELASKLGADQTVNTSGLERKAVIETIKKENVGRGADAVIDFVGNPETSGLGFDLLTKQGRLVLVGLFGGAASFSLPLFPLRGAQAIGSFTGTLTELSELVQLAANGVVRPVVSARYKLDEANQVLQKLGKGEISGRAILRPY
jgi:propanol-preferring alcohol dehydrogenase